MASLDNLEYDKIRELIRGFAASSLGRSVASEMVPYWEAERANRALEETEEMMALLQEGDVPSSGGFRDVRLHLEHVKQYGRPLEPDELLDVKELLEAGRRLREFFSNARAGRRPRLHTMTAPIHDCPELVEALGRKLDRRLGVQDDASVSLARLRSRLRTVDTFLRNKAEELARSEKYRGILAQSRPVLRGGHFLLQVKADHIRRVDGILHDRSNTGVTAFMEPRELVPHGNERKDLKVRESREVQQVLWDLTRSVVRQQARIEATLRRVAWFDFTWAKARMALAFRMRAPRVGGNVLHLRNALHPLLMLRAGDHGPVPHLKARAAHERFDVVPLTFRLGDDFDLLIITGPNTGGKTLALKTVGLLSLMALSGVPVPADTGSQIPDYCDVVADIGDEQSIEQSLSTFSAHMKRVIEIMAKAGPAVLVLLDELGAGTDPSEGAALGRAVLVHLLEKRTPTVVTTHLGDLKLFAYEFLRTENACMEFDPRTLEPTYALRLGLPGNSNALIVAERLGMKASALQEARAALDRKDRRAEAMIDGLQATRIDAERRREASEAMMARAEEIHATSRAEADRVSARKKALKEYADGAVEEQLKRVRGAVDPVLRRLRSVPKPFEMEVEELSRILEQSLRLTPLGERRETFIRGLKKDQMLFIPRLGVKGRVVRVDFKRRKLAVVVGEMRVEVPFEDILPGEE